MNVLTKSALIICVLFAVFSCEKRAEASKETINKELLSFAPEETNVLFYANIAKLTSAPILAHQLDELQTEFNKKAHKEFNTFIEITGFDPRKDVNEFLFAGNYENKAESFVFIAKGTFPEEKLVAFVKSENAKHQDKGEISQETYKGKTLYTFKHHKANKEKSGSVVFLDDKTMIAGETPVVKHALAQRKSLVDNAAFMKKLTRIASNDMYTFVDGESFKNKMDVKEPFKSKIEQVKNVYFGVNANETLSLSFVGECLNTVDAQNIRDAVQGIIAMARIGVSGDRDLIDFMNEVSVNHTDKEVKVNVEITKERLNKLKSYQNKLSQAKI